MHLNSESLRYILGLKLRQLRLDRQWGLKTLAEETGMSVSYLSEIEKGRKYPKPDKLIQLAQALDVTYDELVSPRVEDHLKPVSELFGSSLLQEFPFHLFGMEPEQVVGLVTEVPAKAGALLRTFLEIGRSYNVRVERFLFSALRAYQQLRGNYFEEIEEAADVFLREQGAEDRVGMTAAQLQEVLERRHGYTIDDELLMEYPEISDLRSVFVPSKKPRLLIHPKLRDAQRAFALGRELGYLRLGLKKRSQTSGYVKVETFDQVISDFEAAYFSGAVLLNQRMLPADLKELFARSEWSGPAFLQLLSSYRTTPETFFYRLSQLLPRHFGFTDSFFVRFANRAGDSTFRLTKILNMSGLPIPLAAEPAEHYCRRWPGPAMLGALGANEEAAAGVDARRCRFDIKGEEYLMLTLIRPLSLADDHNTSITIGLRVDDDLRAKIAFCDDPAIARVDVHVTCERCAIADCRVRAAAPEVADAAEHQRRREDALQRLIDRASR